MAKQASSGTSSDSADPGEATNSSTESSATRSTASTAAKSKPVPMVFESKDPVQVQEAIYSVYGSKISEQLAKDLLAFLDRAQKGEYTNK